MGAEEAEALRDAIDNLYAVFAGYPLREWTDPCMHCHTEADERLLHRAPLRELTASDLRRFTDDSLMFWGDLTDLKHFLPRILEIAATEGFDHPDVEVVYGHLAYGGFPGWPPPERGAVLDLALAHWQAELADEGDHESLLAAVMLIADDLTPFLAVWEQSEKPHVLLALGEYAEEVGHILRGRRRWNAYLGVGSPTGPHGRVLPGPAHVIDWLTGPHLPARLSARQGTLPSAAAEAALSLTLSELAALPRPSSSVH